MAPKFHKGEIVSCGYIVGTVITGRVVELKRRADGAPFLMVQITSGPKQGERTWPDATWIVGVGPHESTCRKCERRFRHQDGEDDFFCQWCNQEDERVGRRLPSDRPRTSYERKQLQQLREKDPVTT
jgi:hypothetical protein